MAYYNQGQPTGGWSSSCHTHWLGAQGMCGPAGGCVDTATPAVFYLVTGDFKPVSLSETVDDVWYGTGLSSLPVRSSEQFQSMSISF